MKIRSLFCVALIGSLVFAGRAPADEPAKNYVIFPIKTDLQRVLAGNNQHVYAMVDIAEVLDNQNKVDLQKLDADAFKSDLAAAAKQTGAAKPALALWLRYSGLNVQQQERKPIEDAMKKLGRESGFASTRVVSQFTGGSWQDQIQPFKNLKDDNNTDETCIDDGSMRIYPVRTTCTRFMMGDPSYDCYIELRQPIDGRFKELSKATRERIAAQVRELKLPQTRMLCFKCMTTTAGEAQLDQYFHPHGYNAPPVMEFLKTLGFSHCRTGHTPMGVSPEDLLNKTAPDFNLKALDGSEIQLSEQIRGKVAVIAFWGVGCPACCVEAPYLTALQKQFGEKDLFVVGVNGYDESQETVQKFARQKELKHAIAMQGSKVAKDKYTVASYPVTFIVDREGKIVDYHLDFEPGDEQHLIDAIVKLLAHEKSKSDK